jgi:hypothetical protein
MILKKLALLVGSLLAILLIAELGFRLYYVFMDTRNYDRLVEVLDKTAPPKKEYKWGVDVLARSKCEFCLYENKPNFSGRVNVGSVPPIIQDIKHNSDGLRAAREYPLQKPRDVYKRIAVLGDSGMYGWGLSDRDTYAAILERLLNERYGGRYKFEVINFGVPGYQGIQTIEMFFCKAAKYGPDIVITGTYGLLDLDFFDYFYPKFRFSEKMSYMLFHFSKLLGKKYYQSVMDERLKKVRWAENRGYGKNNLELYPEYEQWIGFENAARRMRKLQKYVQDKGGYLLDVTMYFGNDLARLKVFDTPDKTITDPVERIRRTREMQITTIDGYLLAEDYIRKTYPNRKIDVFKTSLLCLSPTDPHPNGVANTMLAEATVRQMLKDGVIPK